MKIKLAIVILIISASAIGQKSYVNRDWDLSNGNPSNGHDEISCALDPSGNLVYLGNHQNGNNSDIFLNCIHPNGNVAWQQTCPSSATEDDWGIDLVIDGSGNIYVTGVHHNGFNKDYFTAKYTQSGILVWQQFYNGSSNGDDLPSAIDIDDNGNVYVLGTSEGGWTMTDLITIKYDSNGNEEWVKSYNYNNKAEIGSDITVDNNGDIIVLGTSANSFVNADYVLRKYDINGNVLATKRHQTVGNGYDYPHEMVVDNTNNVYVIGTSESSNNHNIKTIALDDNLDELWVNYIDDSGSDEGFGIDVDNFNGVGITGYITNAQGGKNFVTVKYDATNGALIWRNDKVCDVLTGSAKGKDVHINQSGELIVVGSVESQGQTKYLTRVINPDGSLRLEEEFMSQNQTSGVAEEVIATNDEIFVVGRTEDGVNQSVTSVNYRRADRPLNPVSINGVNAYLDDEIIVQFLRDEVNTATVDDKSITFGPLIDFVSSNVINELQTRIPTIDWNKVTTYKIFNGLSSTDNISITRTGFEYEVPAYWATFILEVPNQDELALSKSLEENTSNIIRYAQVNELYSLSTNDIEYNNQHSLYPNTYPDGDINIEPAWLFETGKDNILVGVYDSGIRTSHDDLGEVVDPVDGKIRGGKDYYTGGDINTIPDNGDPITGSSSSGHGTKVAGIIGAYSNNGFGVAGIGGGFWPYAPGDIIQGDPDSTENKGLSLYAFRVVTGGILSVDATAEALIEGSLNTTGGYGYGLHILNCSFKKNINALEEDTLKLMYDAQQTVFRNHALIVAGKGNDATSSKNTPSYSLKSYEVLSVGGSDTTGNKHPNSDYGNGMDVIAPHSPEMIVTTGNNSDTEHTSFSGTSAATAHAAGVAGLMLSYINDQTTTPNNLFPEDVDFLIGRYANDRDSSNNIAYSVGYDNLTGWGLLDAGNVMQNIDRNQYVIKHYFKEVVFDTTFGGCFGIPCGQAAVDFINYSDQFNSVGDYKGSICQISTTIPNNLNVGDVIIDSWPLNSYTNGIMVYSMNNDIEDYHHEQVILNQNFNETTLRTRTIHFEEYPDGSPADFWWPFKPGGTVRFGYTLHIQSAFASIDDTEIENDLKCYPNPTTGNFDLSFELLENSNVAIEILNLEGQIVYNLDQANFASGQHVVNIDVSNLANGLYVIRLSENNKYRYVKLVKN